MIAVQVYKGGRITQEEPLLAQVDNPGDLELFNNAFSPHYRLRFFSGDRELESFKEAMEVGLMDIKCW